MPIGISMENEVLNFVSKRVSVGETSTIAMVNGMGKNVLFKLLSTNLSKVVKKDIIEFKIANNDDFEILIKDIDEHYQDSIFLVIIENEIECYEYLEKINNYRLKYSNEFVIILITTLFPIFKALQNSLKIITKSLYICQPVNEEDSKIVTDAHQSYYNYKIPDDTQKQIFDLSGGNIGIMKCIFLHLWEKNSISIEIDQLLTGS